MSLCCCPTASKFSKLLHSASPWHFHTQTHRNKRKRCIWDSGCRYFSTSGMMRDEARNGYVDVSRVNAPISTSGDMDVNKQMAQIVKSRLQTLIGQWSPNDTTNVISQVIFEIREAMKSGVLPGSSVALVLKFLYERRRYTEAWDLARDIMEHVPPERLQPVMPMISSILLQIASRLGAQELGEVITQLVAPQGANKWLWYYIFSDRPKLGEKFTQALIRIYDEYKGILQLDEVHLELFIRFFEDMGDKERLVEVFEARCLDDSSPIYIPNLSSRLLKVYFDALYRVGMRLRDPRESRDKIVTTFNTLCVDSTHPNHVQPTVHILAQVIKSCATIDDRREFFSQFIVPFMRSVEPRLTPDQAVPLIYPIVHYWWKEDKDYKSIIWFYERHFQGPNKLCEWDVALLNVLMDAYLQLNRTDMVIEVFDQYFATNRYQPTASTFNVLLRARCAQSTSFQFKDAVRTFEEWANSLPTTAPPPQDYNEHLQQHRELVLEKDSKLPSKTTDTTVASVAPGVVRGIITSLLERKNVDGAIRFFNLFCQDTKNPHFVVPLYQSIREITQAILEIEKNPEKALTFVEKTKVDANYRPPKSLVDLLDRIQEAAPKIHPGRVHAQRYRFKGLGAQELYSWDAFRTKGDRDLRVHEDEEQYGEHEEEHTGQRIIMEQV